MRSAYRVRRCIITLHLMFDRSFRTMKRNIFAVILSFTLATSLCPAIALGGELQSAAIEDAALQASDPLRTTLKSKGAIFDLKEGKVLTTSKFYRGVGNLPYYMRLDSMVVSDSSKIEGYKEAQLSISFKIKKNMTVAQKKKIIAAWKKACKTDPTGVIFKEQIMSNFRYFLVDYFSGKNLENPNNTAHVTRQSTWSFSSDAAYKDKLGWWFRTPVRGNVKVIIQYPSSYKNLCLGFGADRWSNSDMSKYDASFNGSATYTEKGKKKKVKPYAANFYQTDYLNKARNNYHFVRLA